MKGHKSHHHGHHARKEGGRLETPETGKREYEEDLNSKPDEYDHAPLVEGEADKKKRGGRAKRKHGGHVHHEHGKELGHAKHVGHVEGAKAHHHAGRKMRKAGGRAGGSNANPLSSAHAGILPHHHKDANID
jgi:hypothetical protein